MAWANAPEYPKTGDNMTEVAKRLVLMNHAGSEGRAAWFSAIHRPALSRAAGEPGFSLIEVEKALLDEVDPNMAEGRLTGGRPDTLPVMLRAGFDRLLALAEQMAAAGTPGAVSKPSSPWDAIVVGSVILASESKDDGWHECVVLAVNVSKQSLTLRWRDYPDYEPFSKPISRVGLLPNSGLR